MPSFGLVAEAEAVSTAALAILCCATCNGVASIVSLSSADGAPAASTLLNARLNGVGHVQGSGLYTALEQENGAHLQYMWCMCK
jgi:hypothetical protein